MLQVVCKGVFSTLLFTNRPVENKSKSRHTWTSHCALAGAHRLQYICMAHSHCTEPGPGQGTGLATIGDNGCGPIPGSLRSVNISLQFIGTH